MKAHGLTPLGLRKRKSDERGEKEEVVLYALLRGAERTTSREAYGLGEEEGRVRD